MYRIAVALTLGLANLAAAQFPPEFVPPPEFGFFPIPCRCPPERSGRISEKRGAHDDAVLRWNNVVLNAIKAEQTPPPIAARNLAIVHVAIFDAMNSVRQTYQTFLIQSAGPTGASPEAAAAVAAHRALLTLYPKQLRSVDAALDDSLEAILDGPAKLDGIRWGQLVAEKVLDWRKKDLTPMESTYAPRSDLGRWQPTFPQYRPPLLPEWSNVQTFALKHTDDFRPVGPPALTSDEFAKSFREVKVLGGVNSRLRTPDETEIAHFWEDGSGTVTPPGHWNRIAAIIARQRGNTATENARLFALLNVAMADAAIACWDCKYSFDFWRPVTAIRSAARLNNLEINADPDWKPLLETPPFPSYTSGHSSFSGAGAAVLAELFGSDKMRFTTTSDRLPGVQRSFARFSDAAMEAGMSRIYGGIHWNFDNTDGLDSGRKVGEYVAKRFCRPLVEKTDRSAPGSFAMRGR